MTDPALAVFLDSLTPLNSRYRGPGDTWTTATWWTPEQIIFEQIPRHQAGVCSLAWLGVQTTNWLLIDCDTHGPNAYPLAERVPMLLEAFGPAALACRSSKSGGVHFYIFLDKPLLLDLARAALRNKLYAMGFPGADTVEIYPDRKQGIRLPWNGSEWRPLPEGEDTLAALPIADRKRWFMDWRRKEMTPLKSAVFAAEWGTHTNTPPKPTNGGKRQPVQQSVRFSANSDQLTGRDYWERVYILIEHGLQGPGTRYDDMCLLSHYCHTVRGMSNQETEAWLIDWLDRKHNGQSNCYKTNPRKAYDLCRYLAHSYDPDQLKGARRTAARVQPTAWDKDLVDLAGAVQTLGHKDGREADSGEWLVTLPYNLLILDRRLRSRKKIARCLRKAIDAGLMRVQIHGTRGMKGTRYWVSPLIIHGRHQLSTNAERLERVQALVDREGTQAAAARFLGVSAAMLSAVINGKKRVPRAWESKLPQSVNQNGTHLNTSCSPTPAPVCTGELLDEMDSLRKREGGQNGEKKGAVPKSAGRPPGKRHKSEQSKQGSAVYCLPLEAERPRFQSGYG